MRAIHPGDEGQKGEGQRLRATAGFVRVREKCASGHSATADSGRLRRARAPGERNTANSQRHPLKSMTVQPGQGLVAATLNAILTCRLSLATAWASAILSHALPCASSYEGSQRRRVCSPRSLAIEVEMEIRLRTPSGRTERTEYC